LTIIDGNKITKDFIPYSMLKSNSLHELKRKIEFILANIYEQNIQIMDRFYFHENSFVLCPINSLELGKPADKVFSQYGYLSIKLLSWIMKLYGGININNYEKAKKTLDLAYLLVGLLLLFFIFKDNFIRLTIALLFGIALYSKTYHYFAYAPTLTPFRHLFDILILFLLIAYQRKRKIVFLYLSLLLSLLSIWFAKDFGIFIFLSIVAVFIITATFRYLKGERQDLKEVFGFVTFIIIGLISFKLYPLMPNPSIKYFLDGFYNFPFTKNYIFITVILTVISQWILFILFYKKIYEKGFFYGFIFLIFYTQFLYSYYVWHGTTDTILMYSYIFGLPILIVLYIFKANSRIFLLPILIFLSWIYVNTFHNFVYTKKLYDDIFETHKLYKWDHPRAGGIIATYSFEPFEDSIRLIKKSFFELRSTIVTEDEFNMIKDITLKKAEILFVDNDIERDFNKELQKHNFFDIYDPFFERENIMQRIEKLKVLKRLWIEVKNNYRLIEKGKLISVYERIK